LDVEEVILTALAKKREERQKNVQTLVKAFRKAWIAPDDSEDISSTTMEAAGVISLMAENGKSFALKSETTVLGRNSATKNILNDIDLSELDVKKIVSRRHATIKRQGSECILYDLDSRNGTFVNG
jgi:pSer/pThr/pTyr-binding forkhead associated (FHA) protein